VLEAGGPLERDRAGARLAVCDVLEARGPLERDRAGARLAVCDVLEARGPLERDRAGARLAERAACIDAKRRIQLRRSLERGLGPSPARTAILAALGSAAGSLSHPRTAPGLVKVRPVRDKPGRSGSVQAGGW